MKSAVGRYSRVTARYLGLIDEPGSRSDWRSTVAMALLCFLVASYASVTDRSFGWVVLFGALAGVLCSLIVVPVLARRE